MKNIIGVCGEPATGKTTLVRALIASLATHVGQYEKYGTLEYLTLRTGVVVLGRYTGETFDGTDKLSMNVVVDAEKWLAEKGPLFTTMVFEGDRLFCARWIRACIESGAACRFIQLSFSPAVFSRRYRVRREAGNAQKISFIKGRRTKYANLRKQFPFIEYRINDTSQQMADLREDLVSWVRRK